MVHITNIDTASLVICRLFILVCVIIIIHISVCYYYYSYQCALLSLFIIGVHYCYFSFLSYIGDFHETMLDNKVNPVLAPDQFSVARPLRPEDLDRQVTRHGIYPSLPAPNGVPWSEYVRTQRNRSRSVSSSTEALESDHARYIQGE